MTNGDLRLGQEAGLPPVPPANNFGPQPNQMPAPQLSYGQRALAQQQPLKADLSSWESTFLKACVWCTAGLKAAPVLFLLFVVGVIGGEPDSFTTDGSISPMEARRLFYTYFFVALGVLLALLGVLIGYVWSYLKQAKLLFALIATLLALVDTALIGVTALLDPASALENSLIVYMMLAAQVAVAVVAWRLKPATQR